MYIITWWGLADTCSTIVSVHYFSAQAQFSVLREGAGRMLGQGKVLAPLGGVSTCEGYLVATDDAIVVFSRWWNPVHKDTAIAKF